MFIIKSFLFSLSLNAHTPVKMFACRSYDYVLPAVNHISDEWMEQNILANLWPQGTFTFLALMTLQELYHHSSCLSLAQSLGATQKVACNKVSTFSFFFFFYLFFICCNEHLHVHTDNKAKNICKLCFVCWLHSI